MSPWILVVISGFLETGWAIGLKYSEGFTKPIPSVLTLIGMIASVIMLSIAVRSLPVGTAYAVWVGIGAFGTAILGIVLLGEAANALRLISLALLLTGILGLKLASKPPEPETPASTR
jgi:quaternary ammonium compound-resistance protein SugE